jgi:Tfp pilus assembly protein PilX
MLKRSERGAALFFAILFALVGAIMSYAMLILAVSNARQAKFYRTRMPARYAAEAGTVWGRENLYSNPTWGGGTLVVDPFPPGPGGGDAINVLVTVNPVCGAPPCPNQTVQATVIY